MVDSVSSDVPYLLEIFDRHSVDANGTQLKIIYGGNIEIQGDHYSDKDLFRDCPSIEIDLKENLSLLTLVMIDPDAPNADQPITGPFIHWILTNFRDQRGENGQHFCPYWGPGPRQGSGKHRYIYLLYRTEKIIEDKRIFDQIEQRRRFPLEQFVTEYHLELIAMNFFVINA